MRKVVTVPVPESLKWDMECFRDVNWAEVGRQAFRERVEDLRLLREIKNVRRGFAEKGVLDVGEVVGKGVAKNLRSRR